MPLDLDPLEQRLVGVLIEKETTVPDAYPLTVLGLVTGANQKNNRDPVTSVQDYHVEGALKSLLQKGWVLELEREGGRTRRYAHQADKQLGVGRHELALLAELLLRGPQAPGELRTRAERMAPQTSPEEVERRLVALATRPVPYVRRLERRPREHAARWQHLLGPVAAESASESKALEPVASAQVPHGAAPVPTRTPAPLAPSPAADAVAELRAELDELRRRVDALERYTR
jgi:uncharacterized protein YceH (UPF0502 family)